jgi:hypothetical protein
MVRRTYRITGIHPLGYNPYRYPSPILYAGISRDLGRILINAVLALDKVSLINIRRDKLPWGQPTRRNDEQKYFANILHVF